MTLKSLDPRLRGDDDPEETPRTPPDVMPAKAGIQGFTATGLGRRAAAGKKKAPPKRGFRVPLNRLRDQNLY